MEGYKWKAATSLLSILMSAYSSLEDVDLTVQPKSYLVRIKDVIHVLSLIWYQANLSLRLLRLGRLYIGVVGCFALQKHPPLDLVCPRFHPLSSFLSPPSLDSPFLINVFSDEGLSPRTWGCQDCRVLSLFVCVSYQ